jgi:cyclohexa-1,5-dienecarbonyl-CoA hydratase
MSKIITQWLWDGAGFKIILNAPKGNILDIEMMKEIHEALDKLSSKKDLKLIIFAGAGENFSYGASVKDHTKTKAKEMLSLFHGIFYKLIDLSVLTAAEVKGQCLGGAMELVAFSNFVFADPETRFAQPEIQLGVFPPPACLILPLRIGQARADEIILTGRSIRAGWAREIGLVTEVTSELSSHLEAWAKQEILPKSAASLRYSLKAARYMFNQTIKEKLPIIEKIYLEQLMATYDANEGIASFLEKRKPVWRNE